MTADDQGDRSPSEAGATTGAHGTPMAVDIAADPRTRRDLAMFVGGPVVWFGHFVVVYLVAEAGCTGGGPGLRLFGPPVPRVVTLAATVVAFVACLAVAGWEYRRWRERPRQPEQDEGRHDDQAAGGALAFTGLLLALVSGVSVLFVGLPALVLPSC